MTKISTNFTRGEFACKDNCGFDTVDVELITVLEDLRYFFGQPVTVTSGCRCPTHNEKEGGSPGSKHLEGKAADIKVADTMPEKVYTYLDSKYPDKYGIGLYSNRVHVDVRATKARWHIR